MKAIGRVDWDFVFSDLQKSGYGGKFIYVVKIAFTNIQLKLK